VKQAEYEKVVESILRPIAKGAEYLLLPMPYQHEVADTLVLRGILERCPQYDASHGKAYGITTGIGRASALAVAMLAAQKAESP
jgi:hypothetical protein